MMFTGPWCAAMHTNIVCVSMHTADARLCDGEGGMERSGEEEREG
jgi:hypothetical protein